MKTLLNNDSNNSYTHDAVAFEAKIGDAIRDIFASYVALGYSPRELAYLAGKAVLDIELIALLDKKDPL